MAEAKQLKFNPITIQLVDSEKQDFSASQLLEILKDNL